MKTSGSANKAGMTESLQQIRYGARSSFDKSTGNLRNNCHQNRSSFYTDSPNNVLLMISEFVWACRTSKLSRWAQHTIQVLHKIVTNAECLCAWALESSWNGQLLHMFEVFGRLCWDVLKQLWRGCRRYKDTHSRKQVTIAYQIDYLTQLFRVGLYAWANIC